MLTHDAWRAVPGLVHGFLGTAECVAGRSWPAVLASLGVTAPVFTPHQVHGTRIVSAGNAGPRPDADASFTTERGCLVGVVTADCVPVLLLDARRGLAAAAHAGWRGASAGVLDASLARLRDAGAEDVEAAVGPAAGGCCYQVGDEVRTAFRQRSGDVTAAAWTADGARWRLDLRGAVRSLLAAAGPGRVSGLGPCTICGVGHHSSRRDGAGAGRQLSFIGWR
jgi:YfiH family protein